MGSGGNGGDQVRAPVIFPNKITTPKTCVLLMKWSLVLFTVDHIIPLVSSKNFPKYTQAIRLYMRIPSSTRVQKENCPNSLTATP